MPPLYEYECDTCGHRVEQLQRTDDPPPVCSPCDERMPAETPYMTKRVSRTYFTLAGSGWARDGYGG